MNATSSLELSRILELTEGAAHADMFRVAPPEFGFDFEQTDDYVARFAPGMDEWSSIVSSDLGVELGNELHFPEKSLRR